ncbi:hypothetical protein [Oceanobacillus sojae]|uniref:hypothetical protein n=1 Tax=Oceanobacillus sojae TaxID=582851 RepID=UPI0021A3BB01|nr:hypothetical protein [Oceanobacillus sojae]MCT1902362.1 hypothetical protein [Oceanobacillus sojae]
MRLKKSYFAAPGIALLLFLGACQGASQAETDTSQEESDEETVSGTEDDQTEATEGNQEDSTEESENNSNEEQQAEAEDSSNEDASSEKENTEAEDSSNSNIEETDYSSEQEAINAIENYEEVEQTNIDLGHGVKALSEGATGHNYVSWNEGKWLIRVNAPTDPELATGNYKDGEELARAVVDYLETNYLPAPDERGVIEIADFDEHPGTVIRWQKGSTVYEIDESTDNPIDALQIAVESES